MNIKSLRLSFVPVLVVLSAIIVCWYVAAAVLNTPWQQDKFERADNNDYSLVELLSGTMSQERPVLPSPHQVAQEVYNTTVKKKITSKPVSYTHLTLPTTPYV